MGDRQKSTSSASKSRSYISGGPATPPTSSKRPKIDTGTEKVDFPGVLDMDSDDTREEFKCPICFDLFLGEIYQCSSGHLICKICLIKTQRKNCAQCEAPLKDKDDKWIRSRCVEQILDSYRIKCRFHKNGCTKALPRGEIQKHMNEECVFNGTCIQICRFFTLASSCKYWTRVTQPEEVMNHFVALHNGLILTSDHGYINDLILALERVPQNKFHVNPPFFFQRGKKSYLIYSFFTKDNTFSVSCIEINQPMPNEEKLWDVVLFIKSQSPKVNTDIAMHLPVVNVLDCLPVLRLPPISISRAFLEEHYLDHSKELKVSFFFRNAT